MDKLQITDQRQKEIIHDLAKPKKEIKADADEIVEAVARIFKKINGNLL